MCMPACREALVSDRDVDPPPQTPRRRRLRRRVRRRRRTRRRRQDKQIRRRPLGAGHLAGARHGMEYEAASASRGVAAEAIVGGLTAALRLAGERSSR